MKLDDFKDIPSARFSVQVIVLAAVFILIVCFAYFFILSPQMDEFNASVSKEVGLKQEFITKKKMAVNRVELENQLNEIKVSFGALLRQLPTKSEIGSLLAEINQAGVGRGLQFDLFRPDPEQEGHGMAILPIHIKLSGSYQDLATFVSDVGQLSRIVTIGDITLLPLDKNNQKLSMQATAKTYRALDAEKSAPVSVKQ